MIRLFETKPDALDATSELLCFPKEPVKACVSEPVWVTAEDLMQLDCSSAEPLSHEIVDLDELVRQKPELEAHSMMVTIQDDDPVKFFQKIEPELRKRWAAEDETRRRALPMELIDSTELLRAEYKPPEFLVEHLIAEQGITLFTGDSGSLKTAFAIHAVVAIATQKPVAGHFPTSLDPARPIIYMNGEMSRGEIQRYLAQAVAGLGEAPPYGALKFFGKDGVASFGFDGGRNWRSAAFEATLETCRPRLVVLDSLRALAEIEEVDVAEVRPFFNWLRKLSNKYGCAFLVTHHLRKLGQFNNDARERVAGSRDLIANCDVHVAAISTHGGPMKFLELGKTRVPSNGIPQGTKWQIEARLEFGPNNSLPPKSVLIASPPQISSTAISAIDKAKAELRLKLAPGVPMTRQQLGAEDGSLKRAFDGMLDSRKIIPSGKDGRKTLYTLEGSGDTIGGQPGQGSGQDLVE